MMDIPMNSLGFRFMSFYFRYRDYFSAPTKTLERIGIQAGANVLDFGAGSGSYSIPAAQLVGPTGEVYAADIHPLSIKEIRKKAEIKGIRNLHTILTDCKTRLPDSSIDFVLELLTEEEKANKPEIISVTEEVLDSEGIECDSKIAKLSEEKINMILAEVRRR
jgi:ubiquinone/menaquinone biosynthesis C-methylase UbiE